MSSTAPIPIAIIGMSCRFPGGANDPELLWDMLAEGRSGWTDVPAERFNWKSFHHPSPEARGTQNSRGGHFIDQDISEFDNLFFGITPEEASSLDPQQRFQLMTAYEALENAGIPVESVRGSATSVHIAVVSRDYDRMIYKDPSDIPKYHLTGCGDATVCGRISYCFDFRGPSVTLDTGCSGGMVALHQACQGLRLGETSMALVGGTNLLLGPDMTIAMSMLHMLNDDGKCYSFDSRGSGYGRSEGVSTIVLKRLDDALLAGDPIRAVIRNSGINQDGKTNGILLPSSESQADLARSMYKAIDLDPYNVDYVEAHGTGTAAGDAAELGSIGSVFCNESKRTKPLYVGSVKANIGHLESASGLAGILKTVMAMEKRIIPPVPNILKLKENLNLEKNNILIPQELQQWPSDGLLRASINSFGFGGTNTHLILESAPNQSIPHKIKLLNGHAETIKTNGTNGVNGSHALKGSHSLELGQNGNSTIQAPLLFLLSAKSKTSLIQNANRLQKWLSTQNETDTFLPSLVYTLSTRRSKLAWRSSFVASSTTELIQSLSSPRPIKASITNRISFLFTGQGSQWFAMGRELLNSHSLFHKSLAISEEVLLSFGASWRLLDELHKDESNSRVNEGQISQPATIAIQIALFDILKGLSIDPHAVVGHSSGEVGAAYACGILSRESALKVAYYRGFASTWYKQISDTKGAMIAVGLSQQETEPYISLVRSGTLSIACQNSPVSTTVSGDEDAIDELKVLLDQETVFNRKLKIDTAYHSHHMKKIADRYLKALGEIEYVAPLPSTQFFSSVSGQEKTSDFGASYWVQNLTSTVRFSDALQELALNNAQASNLFLELGPHSGLQGPVRQSMTGLNNDSLKYSYLPTLLRGQDAQKTILDLVGKLFEQGCSIDFAAIKTIIPTPSSSHEKVLSDLPPYAWDLTKHWHESRLSRDYRFRAHSYHDLLGLRVIGSTTLEPSWRNILSVDGLPWLHEHIIDNFALFPGSGFLCMAIEAMVQVNQEKATPRVISKFILKDITFSKALIIPDSPEKVEVILSLRSANSQRKSDLAWETFRITSLGADDMWNEHCQGTIALEFASSDTTNSEFNHEEKMSAIEAVEHLEQMKIACTESVDSATFYDELRKNGVDYGKTFSTIQKLQIGPCQALANVIIPDVAACMPANRLEPHVIHPATFDALMHIALPLYSRNCSKGAAMLISIDEVTVSSDIFKSVGDELVVACDLTPMGPLAGSVDVSVFQSDIQSSKRQILTLSGQTFRGISDGKDNSSSLSYADDKNFLVELRDSPESVAKEEIQRPINIIYGSDDKTVSELAGLLSASLEATGTKVLVSKEIPEDLDEATVFVILEHHKSPLRALDNILSSANLSMLVNFVIEDLPTTTKHTGQLCTLNLVGQVNDASHATTSILLALSSALSNQEKGLPYESDYFYTAGQLKVPRLLEATAFSEWAARVNGKQTIELGPLYHEERSLKLNVQTPGLLDSLVFIDDEITKTSIGSDEIEIDVRAHAVNQKDVVIAMGRLSNSTPMIGELSGIVTAVGKNAQNHFKIGDRVCGFGGSSYGSKSRINYNLAQQLPESFSFEQGASIPYAFQTAYHAIIEVANLQRGESVLIHSALSAVGTAAILIAKHVGAQIFATVSSEDATKRESLVSQFDIPPRNIFSNTSSVFRRGIWRITGGRGVDVVFNSLPGMLSDTWACVADFGTIVDISKSKEVLPSQSSEKTITFASIDMSSLAQKRPQKIKSLFGKVISLFNDGDLKVVLPLTEMSFSNIVDAFRLVQLRKHTGKVILTIDENTQVRQLATPPSRLQFTQDGTYLIAGGDYTTIKNICSFLAAHGAKNVVLLGAHNSKEAHNQIVAESESLGVSIKSSVLKIADIDDGITVNGIFNLEDLDLGPFETENLDFLIKISQSSSPLRLFTEALVGQENQLQSNPRPTYLTLGALSVEAFALVLEYAAGPQAQSDDCRHLVFGVDPNSIVDNKFSTAQSPLLSLLKEKTTSVGVNGDTKDNTSIAAATTVEEAERIATQLIVIKLSALVAIDQDDIDLSIPFSELGLDSLVAIDFKNWIGRAFASPMQTSEILDSSSIRSLAALIVKRSTLITPEKRAAWSGAEAVDVEPKATPKKQTNGIKKVNGVQTALTSKPKLPRLPLPDLESSLQAYLNAVRPFCSDKEFANTFDIVNEFKKPGGIGRKLHSRLQNLDNDPEIDCWMENLYNGASFLNRRVQLVPFSNFFFTHKISPFPHTQTERAAIIAESAFQYQKLLEGDKLPTQYLNEQPVCTYLNQWLFNATRRPGHGVDTMHKFPGNEYFVTLSRGRVFKTPLVDPSGSVSYKKLKATFDAILDITSDSPMLWTGILTADERNSWAQTRERLQEINASNSACLDTIEAASFLMCLDDAAPSTSAERARHYHYGDGSNRWNDKSLQFPVCSNGISGIIGDHSMIDAGTVFGMNAFVTRAIMEFKRPNDTPFTNGTSSVVLEEFPLAIDESIELQIERVKEDLREHTTGVEHEIFTIENLGATAFRSVKCPPKSAIQVIAMMASYEHFGGLEPCWESASLSNFYKGRIENNQGLLAPTVECINSVNDGSLPVETRRKLFLEAAKSHASSVTRAVRFRGFDRYLTSLRQVSERSEGRIALYNDPIYSRTRPRKFMAHCHETGMLEQAYLMREPDAIWLHSVVEDNCVRWSAAGPIERTKEFRASVEKAASQIKALFSL